MYHLYIVLILHAKCRCRWISSRSAANPRREYTVSVISSPVITNWFRNADRDNLQKKINEANILPPRIPKPEIAAADDAEGRRVFVKQVRTSVLAMSWAMFRWRNSLGMAIASTLGVPTNFVQFQRKVNVWSFVYKVDDVSALAFRELQLFRSGNCSCILLKLLIWLFTSCNMIMLFLLQDTLHPFLGRAKWGHQLWMLSILCI